MLNVTEKNVCDIATYYFNNTKNKTKTDFFNELRNPISVLNGVIEPWSGEESDFAEVLDILNGDDIQRKTGAFYTPIQYAEKVTELLRKAIADVPKGNDYVIIDRCAGVGNLESFLTDEELSHCILSTLDKHELDVLNKRFKGKVRYLSESNDNGVDSLTEEFIYNVEIQKYIENPLCNVILFENPPYSDDSAGAEKGKGSRGNTKGSYLSKIMNKEVKPTFKGLVQSKDICNLFIWSGFKYYCRLENDAYILIAPLKYWKTANLVNKTFIDGYGFNRKHFHAGYSLLSCIYWKNIDDYLEEIQLSCWDIVKNKLEYIKDIIVKKIHSSVNERLFDKRIFDTDTSDGIYCASTGVEGEKLSATATIPIYNDNIIGYLFIAGLSFEDKKLYLTRNTLNYRKMGFYLREDNFVEKLPLFCAKVFPEQGWYNMDVFASVADKDDLYVLDKEFLKRCLIFTCLSFRNRCRSMVGSDGRFYINELCFDDRAKAVTALKELMLKSDLSFNSAEQNIIEKYRNIIREIKTKENGVYKYDGYREDFTYAPYQIEQELCSGKGSKLYDMLEDLKQDVKQYYQDYIVKDLFYYELVK